jgi:hypothetical protein
MSDKVPPAAAFLPGGRLAGSRTIGDVDWNTSARVSAADLTGGFWDLTAAATRGTAGAAKLVPMTQG